MNSKSDQELLRDYAEGGDEAAFAEFVRRYVNLVHSAALRMAGGSPMSEDITQSVFLAVAQSARSLSRRAVLSGWLHCTTRNIAANAIRSEMRRKARELEAATMNEFSSAEVEPAWELISPQLDSALGQMRGPDRDVMLLRFFEGRSMSEIAGKLGVSEEAAKKRVARALEKLRSIFAARGVAIPSAIIASALAACSVKAAPAELAAIVASASSAAAAAGSTAGSLTATVKLLALTKFQVTILGLLFAAGVATPVLVGFRPAQGEGAQAQAGLRGQGSGGLQTNQQIGSARSTKTNWQAQTNSALGRLDAFLRQADLGRSVWGRLDREEQEELEFLIWSLPAKDYPKALGLRKELKRDELRRGFEQTLAGYWGELDPAAALAAMQEPRGAGWLVGEILPKWAARNPAAALAWVRQSATEGFRDRSLAQVLPEVARTDLQGALAALEEMAPGMQKQRTLLELVNQWAMKDPASAANYVTNLPFSAQRSKVLTAVIDTWARKDSDAVLTWAQNLPEPEQTAMRERVQECMLRTMEEKDPAQAAAILQQLVSGSSASRAIQNWAHAPSAGMSSPLLDQVSGTVQSWAKADLGAAAQWVEQLPEGRFREFALRGLVEEWKSSDPRQAAEFVATITTDTENDKERVFYPLEQVLSSWAEKDWRAAADWAKGLPDGPTRDAAQKGICGALALSKPAEAASFVAGLPASEQQTKLAAAVAVGWACNDPLAAVQWVAAFPEGQARSRTIGQLGQFLLDGGRDLGACRRWLEGTSLMSAEEKVKLVGK